MGSMARSPQGFSQGKHTTVQNSSLFLPPSIFYLLSLPFPPASLHFVLFSFPPPFSFPFHFLFFLFFPRPFLSPAFPFPLSFLFPESSQEVWLHKCTVMELHRLPLERYSLCGTRSACQSEYAGIVLLHGVLPVACYKRFVSYRVSMVLRGGGVVVICICTRARLGSARLGSAGLGSAGCVRVRMSRAQVAWFLFGSSRKVTFIETGDKDKVTSKLDLLTQKMRSQHSRFAPAPLCCLLASAMLRS